MGVATTIFQYFYDISYYVVYYWKEGELFPIGFINVDYLMVILGYLFSSGNNLVPWSNRKQNVVAQLFFELKYYVLVKGRGKNIMVETNVARAMHAIWIANQDII